MLNLIEFNNEKSVGGITGWHWIKTDSGAWVGPKGDWEASHFPLIQKYVQNPQEKTVIQAGGNLGMYPKLLSKHFNKVYTFEPDPLNFLCLTLNCTEENIVKMQAALGKDNGHYCVMQRTTMQNVGMHRVVDNFSQEKAVIPIVSLDTFNFNNVGLIMLDIELYEYNALLGALQTIENNRPVIFIENANSDIVQCLISRLNYHIETVSKMDTVFIPN